MRNILSYFIFRPVVQEMFKIFLFLVLEAIMFSRAELKGLYNLGTGCNEKHFC